MKVEILHGRLVDGKRDQQANLYLADGCIVAFEHAPDGFVADRTLDASGLVVSPGLVDVCVRLREPGSEYKGTLASELHAAASAGVTTLACPPDTQPTLDEPGLVTMLRRRAHMIGLARVLPLGATLKGLQGQQLSEMSLLAEAGCIAFSNANAPLPSPAVLHKLLQYAEALGFTLWLQAKEDSLTRTGVMHDSVLAFKYGLAPIPVAAETIALATIFELVKNTGARVHIQRMSSAAGVAMVRAAKQAGLPITCDVSVHNLLLSEEAFTPFDTAYRLDPPIRSAEDREALSAGLQDGTIDCLCSDHNPVGGDDKAVPFAQAAVGASAVELLLPLTLLWGKDLNLSQTLSVVTNRPADTLRASFGQLSLGAPADLCIFDANYVRQWSPTHFCSQGKISPFIYQRLKGLVRYTILSGQIVFASTK